MNANVQGRDLGSVANDIEKVIAADRPDSSKAISVVLGGQVETMRESYSGLFEGMALAVVLVFLFLVMNFESWLDPIYRSAGRAVFSGRSHVDALFDPDTSQRSCSDGNVDVHRTHYCQQHSCRDFRQSAIESWRRCPGCSRNSGIYAHAPRIDDCRAQ